MGHWAQYACFTARIPKVSYQLVAVSQTPRTETCPCFSEGNSVISSLMSHDVLNRRPTENCPIALRTAYTESYVIFHEFDGGSELVWACIQGGIWMILSAPHPNDEGWSRKRDPSHLFLQSYHLLWILFNKVKRDELINQRGQSADEELRLKCWYCRTAWQKIYIN